MKLAALPGIADPNRVLSPLIQEFRWRYGQNSLTIAPVMLGRIKPLPGTREASALDAYDWYVERAISKIPRTDFVLLDILRPTVIENEWAHYFAVVVNDRKVIKGILNDPRKLKSNFDIPEGDVRSFVLASTFARETGNASWKVIFDLISLGPDLRGINGPDGKRLRLGQDGVLPRYFDFLQENFSGGNLNIIVQSLAVRDFLLGRPDFDFGKDLHGALPANVQARIPPLKIAKARAAAAGAEASPLAVNAAMVADDEGRTMDDAVPFPAGITARDGQIIFDPSLPPEQVAKLKERGGRILLNDRASDNVYVKFQNPDKPIWGILDSSVGILNLQFKGVLGRSLLDYIADLARQRGNEPVYIMDWGAGVLRAVIRMDQSLKRIGIHNVRFIAYADTYLPDKMEESIPENITFIVAHAKNLPSILKKQIPEMKGIDVIYSIEAMHFIFEENKELDVSHIKELLPFLSP